MKYYEQMNEIEREIMLREAVAFNVSLEGMDESARILLEEAAHLRSKNIEYFNKKVTDQISE